MGGRPLLQHLARYSLAIVKAKLAAAEGLSEGPLENVTSAPPKTADGSSVSHSASLLGPGLGIKHTSNPQYATEIQGTTTVLAFVQLCFPRTTIL